MLIGQSSKEIVDVIYIRQVVQLVMDRIMLTQIQKILIDLSIKWDQILKGIKRILHLDYGQIMKLKNRSKASSEDDNYQPGYIAEKWNDKYESYLQKYGDQEGNKTGENERVIMWLQIGRLERMRKVDKKQYFNGFDQAVLLEKTFSHRVHVREEIEKD